MSVGWALGRTHKEEAGWHISKRLCLTSETNLHEVHCRSAHFTYIPKGNTSILAILQVVFSKTLLSSQLESLGKNIPRKKRGREQSSIFSLAPKSHGTPQSSSTQSREPSFGSVQSFGNPTAPISTVTKFLG